MLAIAGDRRDRILGEPNNFEILKRHKVVNLFETLDAVSSNVKFFELGTGADIFQCRDTVDRE